MQKLNRQFFLRLSTDEETKRRKTEEGDRRPRDSGLIEKKKALLLETPAIVFRIVKPLINGSN